MNYFLGVSCEDYKICNNLFFCHADSMRLYEVLTKYCDYEECNCNYYMPYPNDEEYSSDKIIEDIKRICEKLEENDVFIFFFAGHGSQANGDALLLLPDYDENNSSSAAISVGVLREIFSHSKGFCTAILDACHSGTDIRPIDLSVYSVRGQERGWAVLASCSGNEESYPYREKEQGAFSYFLANSIENWDCDKDIIVEKLKDAVCDEMNEWCEINYKSQHPTINGSIIGRQVIAHRNSKPNKNELIAIAPSVPSTGGENIMNEIAVVEQNAISLWNANEGIAISKSADVPIILAANKKLPEKTILAIKRNYEAEDYESVSEIIWERAIDILRNRILAMGVEFVGEMVGFRFPRVLRR